MSLFFHSSNADESAVQTAHAPLCWHGGGVGGEDRPITMYLWVWPCTIISPLLPNSSLAKRLSMCVCVCVGWAGVWRCVCVEGGAAWPGSRCWLALSAKLSLWGKGCLKGRSWQWSRPLSSLSKYCLCVTDSKATAHWHSPFSHSATL